MLNKLRYWIISKLLTYDERYLLYDALETRIIFLVSERVKNKSLDYQNTGDDIGSLYKLRRNLMLWGN
jgi:hypothetical protein